MPDMDHDDNPILIQSHRRRGLSSASARAPLVLFHDGAGTLFNYFLLRPLGTDVFGLADPRATAQRPWDGGIEEMARYYLECMKTAVKPGPVILGGWSFGGLLALQVAHLISYDQGGEFTVAGIILIDTTCPLALSYAEPHNEEHHIPFKDDVPEHMRQVAQTSMDRAIKMLSQWAPPTWSGSCSTHPPALLLHARESIVSWKKRSPKLDWELYPHEFIHWVISIPGNHFNLFDGGNVNCLSEKLRAGCETFEALLRNETQSLPT
ncbi:thioesterase domain-containing protein [Rhexocercosporidium sp. MPI-PUGE-AT-0058]|nr:thioesterase domain-containing protein [Rhexocercosporidium sp. MPI-PUGE-AT-0058]